MIGVVIRSSYPSSSPLNEEDTMILNAVRNRIHHRFALTSFRTRDSKLPWENVFFVKLNFHWFAADQSSIARNEAQILLLHARLPTFHSFGRDILFPHELS